ncbi:MAG: hypothetical protein ABSE48_14640 [Verrucomicrobiota bacterium]
MARPQIEEEASPYYPRRARWYAPVFYFLASLRRRMSLDRITLPREMTAGRLLGAFFIPCLAIYWRAPRFCARLAMLASVALFLVFILWLGYPEANIAFGLLVSIHATGFVFYCNPLLAGEPFRARLAFTLLALLGIACLLYYPARTFVQNHWVLPLRLGGQVIVVQRSFPAHHIQRGDYMAYALHENEMGEVHNGGAVWVGEGMGLARVLAVAGDHVVFFNSTFAVNGRAQPDLPHMPGSGDFIVPENHWFIWPNLDISGHGNVGESRISDAIMNLANVDEDQYFGKPFQKWFWRMQILP